MKRVHRGPTMLSIMLTAGLIATTAACGDDANDRDRADAAAPDTAATEPAAQAPAADAAISIVEPADGWTASGRIDVRVAVEGVTLDGTKIGQPADANAGVGHWHVYVDGTYAGLSVSDVVSLPNDAMPSIAAGTHEVKVQLHNTDHTPITPDASDSVRIDVPEGLTYAVTSSEPSIAIVAPAEGATPAARTVVRVEVAGVVLDGTKIGLPADDNPDAGHWHVYVDGAYAGLSVSDVISLPNDAMPSIEPGAHEVKVQLHHTDHTPFVPELSDTVTVTFP